MQRFLFVLVVGFIYLFSAVSSATPYCVATYESIGIYWAAETGSSARTGTLKYRKDGTSTFKNGYDLVWDSRSSIKSFGVEHGLEYRGSLVRLTSNTKYYIQLSVAGTNENVSFTCTTWSQSYKIKNTIVLSPSTAPIRITQGGTKSSGYVKYTMTGALNVNTTYSYALIISSPYVIIDGLTIVGGGAAAVYLNGTASDVVIQNCDISGWGRTACDGYGVNYDAGIRFESRNLNITRVTVQRNVIRDPASTANGWCDVIQSESNRCKLGAPTRAPPTSTGGCTFHPLGPQGIVAWNNKGNYVIRYNRIDAGINTNNYFNDAIGGGSNFGTEGFPGPDSDIYGNWMGNSMDDSLEIEGGGMNVRVWGNFVNHTYTGIASTVVSLGPLYIFNNIYYYSRRSPRGGIPFTDNSSGPFAKLGDSGGFGGGRRIFFHNTMLGGPLQGGRPALGAVDPMTNTITRNNVWWLTSIAFSKTQSCYANPINTSGNSLDYDLCSQNPSIKPAHSIMNTLPVFKSGGDYCSYNATKPHTVSCNLALSSTSRGYNEGIVINNFNDGYHSTAPDMGAHEDSKPNMEFGIKAYLP